MRFLQLVSKLLTNLNAQNDASRPMRFLQEPSNLSVLQKNGVRFSLTTHQLKSVSDFHKNLQKAILYGFDKTAALESLTTIPASILGKSAEIGSLKNGSFANFLITSGEIFEPKTTIYENWVQGDKNEINDMNIKDLTGDYTLTYNNKNYKLNIKGKDRKLTSTIKEDSTKVKSTTTYTDNWLNITINDSQDSTKYTQLISRIDTDSDNFKGNFTRISALQGYPK